MSDFGPRQFGPLLIADNATRFRFWAPALKQATLEVEGLSPIPMEAVGGGWFEAEAACGAGAAYRVPRGESLAAPDPAARAMRGDGQRQSVVVDPDAYRWGNKSWRGRPWTETVLYELHVGAFGGFRGVKERLSDLAELGVTAIELMPISDFPGLFNWGYDGVAPFAPSARYGEPDELKALVDAAHDLGLMMFLDVVYNHFGPEGNFLDRYAPHFFRHDVENPWGVGIDFRRPEVRRFFAENAIYWLEEFRFDGLRFDAVHAMADAGWLDETAAAIRARFRDRRIHLVLENDDNVAEHMRGGRFDAQWNDDFHHAVHVLLTGETGGYYAAYEDAPASLLARCLAEGFAYQGEPTVNRSGRPRGSFSADLPATAFVAFLQNHDQVGNRPFGERLTTLADPQALEAAIALQLLCPQIPLLFMGEETASRSPFLYFAEHADELARSIREGRKREFEEIAAAAGELPDPNALSTFEKSKPEPDAHQGAERRSLYRRLLDLRRKHIIPRLRGSRSLGARAIGPAAVEARWELADGGILGIVCNLGAEPAAAMRPSGSLIYESATGADAALQSGRLEAYRRGCGHGRARRGGERLSGTGHCEPERSNRAKHRSRQNVEQSMRRERVLLGLDAGARQNVRPCAARKNGRQRDLRFSRRLRTELAAADDDHDSLLLTAASERTDSGPPRRRASSGLHSRRPGRGRLAYAEGREAGL